MKVIDKIRIIGRGNVVVVDDIRKYHLHVNDKVRVRDLQFEIAGIEFAEYIKYGGLILRPINRVEEIKINDKIEKVMKKLLLVIDCQYDFLDGGKLGVEGSIKTIQNLGAYVAQHGEEYDAVVATVDWHPIDHCSFKDNGGMWTAHCLQHSYGAAIYEPLLNVLNDKAKSFGILTKGTDPDHEEYSIFKNKESSEKLIDLVNRLGIEEIDVVGIAYDYCVADSVKGGLRALPNVKFNVLGDFCPAIAQDSSKVFTDFIENTERVCLVEG